MTSTAGGEVKPELIKSEHNIGYYDPIVEEDTDDEEATKVIEEIKARSHLDREEKLQQSKEVNTKIEKVNVKDEDTDDEFTPTDLNRDSQLHSTRKRKGNFDGTNKKRVRKGCSVEGCTNHVVKGGICIKHGAKVKNKICSYEGCNNQAQKGGVCIKHGAKQTKKICSYAGCINQAKNAGVCIKHGAKQTPKTCSHEGCTNQVINGGVCIRHGAKPKQNKKTCSHEGCTNQVVNGGVCIKHGKKVKTCSYDRCTNKVIKGGVCIKHGAKLKTCSHGGVCVKHGAKVKTCSHEGCTNIVVKGGVCIRHGARPKICSQEGCTNNARTHKIMTSTAGGEVKPELIKSEHNIGYYDPIVEEDTDDEEATKVIEEIRARSHLDMEEKLHQSTDVNAKIEKVNVKDEDTDDEFTPTDLNRDNQLHSTRKRKGKYDVTSGKKRVYKKCSVEECTNTVVKGGVCIRHGAKRKRYTCSHEGCTNQVQNRGVCKRHGAAVKKCSYEGCTKHAHKGGVCNKHGAKKTTCSHEGCTHNVQNGGVLCQQCCEEIEEHVSNIWFNANVQHCAAPEVFKI